MPDASGKLVPGDIGYVPPGAGLINATPGQTDVTPGKTAVGYTAAQATPAPVTSKGYDPSLFSVNPDQTVAEHVKKIVAEDSPLMQQAEARSRQQMNQRGLLNSSLAVQSGQQAVIGAALPIAQQDASTYNQAAINTANAQNAAKGLEAQAANTASIQGAQIQSSVSQFNADAVNKALGATASALVDQNTKMALAQLDANNRQLLQTNVSAGNMFQEVVKNIAAIATDSNLSKDAKDSATASQLAFLNEGLKQVAAVASTEQAAITSLDLSRYFINVGATA